MISTLSLRSAYSVLSSGLLVFALLPLGSWGAEAGGALPKAEAAGEHRAIPSHGRNLFTELLGKSNEEVASKLSRAYRQLFFGKDDSQRVFYPVGTDAGYIADVGNNDVRSEGISYGMMIAVQMNDKEVFDRIWKWAKVHMYHKEGPRSGYFAWQCKFDGTVIDPGSACDGEEWIAMALWFASGRWGDGEGIFNYRREADMLLSVMLHKGDGGGEIHSMFDREHAQIVFVPTGEGAHFTDPSYHLPLFYELWSEYAGTDREFWALAAKKSRVLFKKAAHPRTGLMPDYCDFDGTPRGGDHKDFRFDAWRTLANVALDHAFLKKNPWAVQQSNRVLKFLLSQGMSRVNQYTLDGKPLSGDNSVGLTAMAAVAGLAADPALAKLLVQELWDAPIPAGKWRYYDGLLYLMALQQVSGNFRLYPPQAK